MNNTSLTAFLEDANRNIKEIELPRTLAPALPKTVFHIERAPWETLMAMEQDFRNATTPEATTQAGQKYYSHEAGWNRFCQTFVRVKSGKETIEAANFDLERLPQHWRRFLAQATTAELEEGFNDRAREGED